MRRWFAAFFATITLAAPAAADGHFWGQWQHGPSEFLDYGAWVSERDGGDLVTATVLCAADASYLSVAWLQGETEQAEGQMQITVDGRPMWLNARYLLFVAEPAWTVRLLPEVIDALRGGSIVTLQVATRGPSTLRLNGSAAAIDAALQGCGTGAGYHTEWANFFNFMSPDANGMMHPVANLGDPPPSEVPPPAALPEDAPITRAELEAGWAGQCPTGVTLGEGAIRIADLDADGTQDVIVNSAALRCEGGGFAMLRGLGNCGMHNCALFIYLSTAAPGSGWSTVIQNHMEIPPTFDMRNGTAAIGTAVQGGSCPFAEVCRGTWQWDGTAMIYTPTQ
ncbi:hypothetical protein [Gymnodinialimonas ulvae]|uniref:hypothetical protein n=1 Tax=Gymnodinialimonas ulvae TaxID=3126504 RepID=UPI00309B7BAF